VYDRTATDPLLSHKSACLRDSVTRTIEARFGMFGNPSPRVTGVSRAAVLPKLLAQASGQRTLGRGRRAAEPDRALTLRCAGHRCFGDVRHATTFARLTGPGSSSRRSVSEIRLRTVSTSSTFTLTMSPADDLTRVPDEFSTAPTARARLARRRRFFLNAPTRHVGDGRLPADPGLGRDLVGALGEVAVLNAGRGSRRLLQLGQDVRDGRQANFSSTNWSV